VDLKDIKAIVDLMKKNSISEFELEKEEFKIKLKRGLAGGSHSLEDQPSLYQAPPQPLPAPAPQIASAAEPPSTKNSTDLEITSPMIGSFYASPSPDSPAYVQVGDKVGPETVVCIVEAMKVMNEIKAEVSGVISEILVDNAKPVEFGQALFKVSPQ
jgi:acetyl-CoA carboxylase biotin carboxyl carrier protein